MKKITLVLCGGVSLGAFEAGAVRELLYAIETSNRKSKAKSFEIDVISGASAGSILGALTAKVLTNFDELKEIIHQAWVKEADIKNLIQGENLRGILSNEFLFNLTDKYLQKNTEIIPASCAPKQLKLGFSLTNQVGIDYGVPYNNPDGPITNTHFSSTFFSDFISFEINYENSPSRVDWKNIATAGVASASFPLVFPPVGIYREREDYPGAIFSRLGFLPNKMHFSDGGVFNNEPLKYAIQMSLEQDFGILSEDRIFIIIDPNLGKSLQDLSFTEPQPFHKTAQRLIAQVMGESQAKDWLKMQGINLKIQWKDRYISRFPFLINELDSNDLDKELFSIKKQIEEMMLEKPDIPLANCLKKIRHHYREVFSLLTQDVNLFKKQNLLEEMIFVLNHLSNLDDKYSLIIHIISSDANMTGGDPFYSFGGFFKEEWREHDYRLGRRHAYKLLPAILGISSYTREEGTAYENDPKWGNLAQESIQDTPIKDRKIFAKLICQKLVHIMENKPLNLKGIKMLIAKTAFKNIINASLKIQMKEWYNPLSWFK